MSLRTLAPRATGLIGARLSSAVLQAGLLIVLARTLGIEEFGRYAIVMAIGAITLGIADLGLSTRALRMTRDESDGLHFTVMAVALLQAALVFFVVLGTGALVTGSSVAAEFVIVGALYAATEIFVNIAQNLAFGEQRRGRIEFIMISRRLLPFAAVLIALVIDQASVLPALGVGFLLAAVVAATASGPFRPGRLHLGVLLRPAVHYWTAGIWAMFQQFDVPIIGRFFGDAAAGAYSAAFRLASPVHIVTSLIVSSTVPAITRCDDESGKYALAVKAVQGGGAWALLVGVLSPITLWLGPLLLGPSFAPLAWVFPLLMLNSAVSALAQVMVAVLYAYNVARFVARVSLIATFVGLAITLIGGVSGLVVLAFSGALVIQLMLVAMLTVKLRRVFATERQSL